MNLIYAGTICMSGEIRKIISRFRVTQASVAEALLLKFDPVDAMKNTGWCGE
jgi:hypothetical protein